jgi:hypothetical protein
MLSDARSRVADQSGLGQHLAIVGADGIGELAIGICAHKRGVLRRDTPLPATLSRLLGDLSATEVPGEQGFRELHAARNHAQHQGILPAPEQLPRWLDETEALVMYLVERCFGVDLSTIGSASAVGDEQLGRILREAEEAIEDEKTTLAIECSWRAVENGLTVFRRHTGLGGDSPGRGPLGREFSDVQAMEDKIASLARHLELSLFASEPGEWMWFEQRHEETVRGLEPTVGEARRGFVFALSWVLRMESYVSRHGPERWERWHQRRAPETGLPGGPHVQGVSRGRDLPSMDEVEWVVQLTDVPDFESPDFSWAISAAQEQSDDANLKYAYLGRAGELGVRVIPTATPAEIATSVRKLIIDAHEVMRTRHENDQKEAVRRGELLEPFLAALASAGLPVKETLIRPADRGQGPLVVFIELSEVGTDGRSWFSKCLEDCFNDHLEGYDARDCDMGFADVVVPADWPAADVVAWLIDAKDRAEFRDRADREKEQRKRAEEKQFLSELESQVIARVDRGL